MVSIFFLIKLSFDEFSKVIGDMELVKNIFEKVYLTVFTKIIKTL
jgi:hypothetical protein